MSRKSRAQAARTLPPGPLIQAAAARFAAGDWQDAARHCRDALAISPSAADAWHLLAAVALATGDAGGAASAVAHACRLVPEHPDYANTAALVAQRLGDEGGAERGWRTLIARAPRHADAHYNLGRLLAARGDADAARAAFERALALRPDWLDAQRNLAAACFAGGDASRAATLYAEVLARAPRDAETAGNLARLLAEADDFDAAMTCYQRALAIEVDGATLLRFALAAPIFCDDGAAIDAHRARVMTNLRALDGKLPAIAEPAVTLGTPGFYFAYHGRDDRPLQEALAHLERQAWRPAPLPPRPARRARPRIAWVSAHFHEHTIGRLVVGLLERLPRPDYELVLCPLAPRADALAARLRAAADHCEPLPPTLTGARAALHALGAEVIFYCDIGMDPWTRFLAAERLAPVQVTSWGHPVTTGIDNVDGFLSSRLLEPADGRDHYSETLVALPAWPTVYEAPAAPTAARTSLRARFGFAADERIHLCPQSLFKLHPDFDTWLGRILALDDGARIVLLAGRADWQARLAARFARQLGELAARITFLPRVPGSEFAALLAAADVVLDTPHFSGGYTSFETLWAETPLVTTRGAYMRGRVTAALTDLLELPLVSAGDADAYASRAVELAHDGPARRAITDAIAARKPRLLALAGNTVAAYAEFFAGALAGRFPSPAPEENP